MVEQISRPLREGVGERPITGKPQPTDARRAPLVIAGESMGGIKPANQKPAPSGTTAPKKN
jgi:hypothetical protein